MCFPKSSEIGMFLFAMFALSSCLDMVSAQCGPGQVFNRDYGSGCGHCTATCRRICSGVGRGIARDGCTPAVNPFNFNWKMCECCCEAAPPPKPKPSPPPPSPPPPSPSPPPPPPPSPPPPSPSPPPPPPPSPPPPSPSPPPPSPPPPPPPRGLCRGTEASLSYPAVADCFSSDPCPRSCTCPSGVTPTKPNVCFMDICSCCCPNSALSSSLFNAAQ
ncbi:hypothetical protein MKW92_034494 [Papaver armeniacum]|nr:hypothetical protein MKW92_034494 [Papaver armeniacum]